MLESAGNIVAKAHRCKLPRQRQGSRGNRASNKILRSIFRCSTLILDSMAAPFDFRRKVALVTGSSRGIGAGLIEALAQSGATCIVNYVTDESGKNRTDAETVAAKIGASLTIECDVSNDVRVKEMMDEIKTSHGGLDILVNNAGILRDRTLRKMSPAEWKQVLDVNLTGAFNTLHHAADLLRPGGRVINISSVSAAVGLIGQANYSASKAGIIALTKVAAREFARNHVNVNAIAPGFIDTEMSRGIPPEIGKRFVEQIPLGRFGQVEDIVNAALFLASPLADYMTGQVLHVNGGFHM